MGIKSVTAISLMTQLLLNSAYAQNESASPLLANNDIQNAILENATEKPIPTVSRYELKKIYFIAAKSLRLRETPGEKSPSIGFLYQNDAVEVLNANIPNNPNFLEVKLIKTTQKYEKSKKYFIAKNYLSEKFIDYKEFENKYFVIVNVETERLRVYERICNDNSCPHKMIYETEVVVGQDNDLDKGEKGKGRSILGSYRATGWTKFYENEHYPAWFKEGYPDVPRPGNSGLSWLTKHYMPKNAEGRRPGEMRGAFGWYAMFVGPEAYGQWTHGTIGWGRDKDRYIKLTKKRVTNSLPFVEPRSSGCTRLNNESIALLRQILPTGTPVIKIYAKEAYLDSSKASYKNTTPSSWKYIMTKDKQSKADLNEVKSLLKLTDDHINQFLAWQKEFDHQNQTLIDKNKRKRIMEKMNQAPYKQIIEIGEIEIDNQPDVVNYTPGENMDEFQRKLANTGNVYGITSDKMSGTFYADAGMLEDYAHPSELHVGGFNDEVTPPWIDSVNLLQK